MKIQYLLKLVFVLICHLLLVRWKQELRMLFLLLTCLLATLNLKGKTVNMS